MTAAGVVVVAHRSRDDVLRLLADLDPATPTVVVDAGSDDGTAAAVRAVAADRPLRVLELVNTGYARGANAGIRALPADVACAVVVNADVRLAADVPDRLAAVLAADPGLGAVGPGVRYPSGAPQASARRVPGIGTAVLHALLGWWWAGNPATRAYRAVPGGGVPAEDAAAAAPGPVPVDWVSGCAVALRRTAVEAVGGFDPGYPLFVEDVDLCERLAVAGWGVAYAPGIGVTHGVGAATAGRPLRSRLAHARGLRRFLAQRLPVGTRPVLLVLGPVLAAWAVIVTAAGRLRPGRSSTGEVRSMPVVVG